MVDSADCGVVYDWLRIRNSSHTGPWGLFPLDQPTQRSYLWRMPKFKKGHTLGFKPGNVPHNKGTKGQMVKDPPVPFIRLPVELDAVGREQEMPLQAASCHLLRPKKLKEGVAGFSDRRAVKE